MRGIVSLAAILGFLLGVVTPLLGVFLGLQVSPLLGTIFAFPLIAASWLVGEPFGNLSHWISASALLAFGLIWSFIFVSAAKVLRRRCQHAAR